MKKPNLKPWTREELNQLEELYMRHVPYSEITQIMDRSVGALHDKVRRLNLTEVRRSIEREQRARIFEQVPEVSSLKEMSHRTGLSMHRIQRLFRDYSYGFRSIKYYFNNPGKIDCPYW